MDLSYHTRHAASAKRSRDRIKRAGFTMSGQKVWSHDEDTLVRTLFPNYAAIIAALPHRTYFACRSRARALGLVTKRRPWTAKELSIVRRAYPEGDQDEILQLLPGRSWLQINKFASRHRIRRVPKPFIETGVPVLDQIRCRCRELNYTLPDLDKMARTKRYFEKADWHNYTNHRALGRAVDALFGDMKADWK